MNKLLFFLPVLLFLFFTGCSDETETQEEIKVPVKVYKVKPETLTSYLKLSGTIRAEKDQILYSKISERIDQLNVKAGDRVSKDQIIAVQYNAILSKGIEAANANVNSAQAQYELAKLNHERMERLFKQRAVSTQQFEQVTTQLKSASAALESARAQLNQAEEQSANSTITAPFKGVVAAVFVELNQMVSAGQQIAQIIDPSRMKAKVRVASKDIGLLKLNQDVVVSIPSLQEKTYNGKVVSIDRAVDPVSKTLEVEIIITDTDERVKSGLYAEFLIATNSVENSIVVPETALLSQTEVRINKETGTQESVRKYFLFTVNNNKAKLNEVKVGITSNSRAQITSGIILNDNVIVIGNNIVQDGQTINIID